MMKTSLQWMSVLLMALSHVVFAKSNCDLDTLTSSYQQVLPCYIAEPENIEQPWALIDKQYDPIFNVSIEKYTLISQFWPKKEMSAQGTLWLHTLVIYQPDTIKTDQAFLYVNSGTRNEIPHAGMLKAQLSPFSFVAADTHSIVVDLQDIPNQYLSFDDHVPRKEDGIVAYTWNRFMDNPVQGVYWPVHLPMTKAVVKAMDAVQNISAEKNVSVKHFMVSGASKRGLTTWLAALADERINAIVPIVIDILNTKENLNLIYTSYENQFPPAFHAYVEEKIPDRFNTAEFTKLMDIEDPINYLTCERCHNYKKRLKIPKYIISASGDDFFVPDSLNLYLDKLPGESKVRVVPNQSHYIDKFIAFNAVLSYYRMIIHKTDRPYLKWKVDQFGRLASVTTKKKPVSVKLWEAENPVIRDFRLAAQINYSATELNGTCNKKRCNYLVSITSPVKGWKASFVEVTFEEENNGLFVLTTPVYIIKA